MSKNTSQGIGKGIHDRMFQKIHGSNLIYNTCWEDPRLDRELLRLNSESNMVMITSAGCNALDYLLDKPRQIHAVDLNFRQNALLQLKLALFRRGDFSDLYRVFGRGSHPDFPRLLREIEAWLPTETREFWQKKVGYFDPANSRKTFYYRGGSGRVAWIMRRVAIDFHQGLFEEMMRLFAAKSLEAQRELYASIEGRILNRFTLWLASRPWAMAMMGVPRAQMGIIDQTYPGGISNYLRDKLRTVFTEVPIGDNYFWRAYITGSYSDDCRPNYLKPESFETIRKQADKISTHTCSVSDFLEQNPDKYSHFVLLDHQDWLASNNAEALSEEWKLLLENSRSGTLILFRSAGSNADFLPGWVRPSLKFHSDRTTLLQPRDRVGTYGSQHLAEVI